MANEDIIQNMISELGQSQDDRPAPELADHFVDVDERKPDDQLLLAAELAKRVRYYGYDPKTGVIDASKDFSPFFPANGATKIVDGTTPAHLALFRAFLDMRETQRGLMNRTTLLHLDFQYEDVLGFAPAAPVPDHAHVALELKKGSALTTITTDIVFSGGKDATGVPLSYQPVRQTLVGISKVDTLSTVFVDDKLYCAPVASSGDGVGGALPAADPSWPAFGAPSMPSPNVSMPTGAVGFALSSPALRMSEGTRNVTLTLDLGGGAAPPSAAQLASVLQAFFTGPKGWLGPYDVTPSVAGSVLTLTIGIDAGVAAVVDYDPSIHGGAWAADAPIVELLLVAAGPDRTSPPGYGARGMAYGDLAGLVLSTAQVAVDVSGVTSLTLENDAGALDPKKAFMAFGSQPMKGARFMVGYAEALSKALTSLTLSISWQGLPDDFTTQYAGYQSTDVHASDFTATATFSDATGVQGPYGGLALFQDGSPDIHIALTPGSPPPFPTISPAHRVYALGTAGSVTARRVAEGRVMVRPELFAYLGALPLAWSPSGAPSGVVTLTLERGFMADVFRRQTIVNAINHTSSTPFTLLDDPVVPTVAHIELDYQARTSVAAIGLTDEASFANPDVRFFHVDAFGQRREHAYLRKALSYVSDTRVPLFPPHDEGELLVGLTGLSAGDGLSLLFQVDEGSADPDLVWPDVAWAVLGDNQWRALGPGDVVLDTTNALRGSGLVAFVIPEEATTASTLLPAARVWLKAAVTRDAARMPSLVAVLANGVEVAFVDRGNDPAHLATALPARSIAKLGTPVPAVKTVTQPYASFGGRTAEPAEDLRTRASERLRHKDRCIAPWDYERIVLEAFPAIHRVKCIPHASPPDRWLAPGNVLLVVVPDLKHKNGRDPLEPRVDPDTLDAIRKYASARAGVDVTVVAKNPLFQRIHLDFKVKLTKGNAFNAVQPELLQAITSFLSPWAYDATREIIFGGRIYRAVLLDFVTGLGYVDYVTDFKMYTFTDQLAGAPDVAEAAPGRPDAILVSDETHDITLIP